MKIQKYSIAILLAASLNVGCSEMLDIKPTTFISDEAIWEDPKLINQFVANTYGGLLCGFNRSTAGMGQDWSMSWAGNLDSGTDDFAVVTDSPIYTQLQKDAITAQSCPFIDEIWTRQYQLIRKANMIIASVVTVNDLVLSPEQRTQLKAEAHFLRAFAHFELARTFGKAPLILEAQDITDDLLVAPSTFEQIINFIVDECDTYAKDLPVNDVVLGRASQGAFLSLKSRALLYLASPLNSANDATKWSAAANAAKAVMDLEIYELYTASDKPYRNMAFDKTTNTENIFERQFTFPDAPHNVHMLWSTDVENHGAWNTLYPTQNLVDAYETTDGKLIDDPTNTLYDAQNPYANRDSRFYQSILYNGVIWEGDTASMVENKVDKDLNGNCVPALGKVRCGYGLIKFVEELVPSTNLYGGYAQSNNFPYFRYAEILLNYAEAQNEAIAAPDQSVYDAINQVRTRAGQPNLPAGLTKEQMRDRIKNERRVELLIEEHRFYDLRRWKDGHVLAEQIMGMNISYDNVTYTYEVKPVEVEQRAFSGANYYLPIPQSEQDKNPLLKN